MAELDAATEVERDRDTDHQCIRVLIAAHRDEWPDASRDLAALKTSTDGLAPPAWDRSATASNWNSCALRECDHLIYYEGKPTWANCESNCSRANSTSAIFSSTHIARLRKTGISERPRSVI